MKKNILKGTFLAAFVALAASVNAQSVITIDDVTIAPGETATVTLNLSTPHTDMAGFEINIVLPEGITFKALNDDEQALKDAGNKNYKCVLNLCEDHFEGEFDAKLTYKYKKQFGYVQITANDLSECLAETDGPFFTFDIEASSTAKSGKITLSGDINIASNTNEDMLGSFDESTGNITVGGAEPKFEATIASSGRTVTYCADKALDISAVEGLAAYVVAKFTAAQSWLVPVEKVPAMCPVVLEGTAGKVEIPYTDEAVEAPEANLLQPVTEAFTISEAQYGKIWVMSGGKFKKAAVGLNIPVGKAYVELDEATAKLIGDELDIAYGEPTGIETINAQLDDNAPIYNLNGVRVNKLQKGVYIQNGHKFIVK